ncbi:MULTISPECIES: PIG-L deacetylase family protein [Ramlibacter]|uniref:PIG-L family deacetylase n=1 Tax=Ramlibacter pinisoli TaxID=2682844 RepID=A0A6N8IWP3_9BURK|nr:MULTISPECIES: PIG-L deacetylase family protein [Ramlibacter]MBA2961253.1 PIG-L family deacetylase [Ramlibacter sp. CGMCC 1.13660]MVQ31198.1 PIG-L family deacetylase [Ramlibacter pinisoli]
MLPLSLARDPSGPLELLFLGAHCDDIEIGCGGTILQLLAQRPHAQVTWVVFSSDAVREQEARAGAARFLGDAAGRARVVVRQFRDGYFPYQGAEVKQCFDELRQEVDPDVIFTHHRDDRHQDHRTVSDLTWNTWRRHLILEYEIPKYDGDLGTPNLYSPLPQAMVERKARIIREVYRSQAGKDWMAEDTFLSIARLRGIESGAPERHAEAFHCRKLVLGA